MDVQELLDTAKTSQGLTTDKALAAALGVTKQAVSNWRKAVSLPDPVTCATLAGLTGIPLARVLGIVGEARAISREEKAVWRKLAASVGVFLMALSLSIEADAADYVTRHDSGPTLHYAKFRQAVRILTARGLRWLATLFTGGPRDAHLLAV